MQEKIIIAIIGIALVFLGVASYHAWENRGCDVIGCSEPVATFWTGNPDGNPVILERLCDTHWQQFLAAQPKQVPETHPFGCLDLPEPHGSH